MPWLQQPQVLCWGPSWALQALLALLCVTDAAMQYGSVLLLQADPALMPQVGDKVHMSSRDERRHHCMCARPP